MSGANAQENISVASVVFFQGRPARPLPAVCCLAPRSQGNGFDSVTPWRARKMRSWLVDGVESAHSIVPKPDKRVRSELAKAADTDSDEDAGNSV